MVLQRFFLVRSTQGHSKFQEDKARKAYQHSTNETKAKPGMEAQLFLQRMRSAAITPLEGKPVLLSNKSLKSQPACRYHRR